MCKLLLIYLTFLGLFMGLLADINPKLEFFPLPPEANRGSTLIWYKSNRQDNMQYWLDNINKNLEDYVDPKNEENLDENCTFDRPASDGKYCRFDVNNLDNCSPGKTNGKFGYPERKPCIFLKLNKIINWTPLVFNETDESQLTTQNDRDKYQRMPYFLKDALANTRPQERNLVWISCEGENPADVENLGPVNYSPRRGFPAYYFPFKNVHGYQSPIVAVQFEQPTIGVLINIECKAWAKNILHERSELKGLVHFELMVD